MVKNPNIKTKNNIIEHMPNIKGMVAIDKDAIAKESDKRGTSQKGDNINYKKNRWYCAND